MASSRRRLSIATLLQVLSVSFSALAPGQPRVLYTLAMSKPSTHLFEVSMKVESLPPQQTLDFLLPVWRPGMYRVLDLAGGIQEFAAYDGDDRPLRWQKIDKSDWRVEANGTSVVIIRYKVYANEFYQRTRGLNDEHGFVDGTAVFMYLESCRNTPLMLEVQPFHGWHVTTGLDGAGNRFHAPSYDYFVDCPLEVGTQRDFEFTVDRVPHVLSISSEGNWTADTLIRDISKIVKAQKDFWGEFPYKRYVFLVECLPNPTGATEHMNSTIIHTSPFIFKNPDWYRNFLGNVSHEYFHTWNVKQLRPKGMDPYKFQSENYSNELWVAEGTTSYYGNLFMERLGFVKPDKFVSDIAGAVQTDRQQPGNSVQPPSDASFDSWVKGSRGQESAYNFESDIYQRGANVSGILDLQIRKMSGNKHSLDDVMKEMYKRFPLTGSGYTLKDLQSVSEEFSGSSLSSFFDAYVWGARPLPWEESLLTAGIELTPKDSVRKPWVGISSYDSGDRTIVRFVVAGSPAENAGIQVGDELLALNDRRIRSAGFGDRVGEMNIGDSFSLTVFRNDKLRTASVKVGTAPVPVYTSSKVTNPTPGQRSVYESWLLVPW